MAYKALQNTNSHQLNETNNVQLETEVRFLSASHRDQLCHILSSNSESWRLFMSCIPKSRNDLTPKYTVSDINTIETAQTQVGKNAVDILLDEWGTSGRKRPTIQDLANVLRSDETFNRALYMIATEILGFDNIDDIPELDDVTEDDFNNDLIENFSLATSGGNDNLTGITHIHDADNITTYENQTEPTSIGVDVPRLNYSYLREITSNFSDIPIKEGGRKLGEGSFGSVYYGLMNGQLGIDGPVAVKVLKVASDRLEVRFNAEIECMRFALHENILELLAYSNDGDYHCLIYQYMQNGNLADSLRLKSRTSPLTAVQRLQIAMGTAKGLSFLHNHSHEKSLVHRDVKPENILLDDHLKPKLCDFGLVRLTGEGDYNRSVEQTSLLMGTPLFMAPEALRGEVSYKNDVYSFGVVLLELLTSVPACGDSRTEHRQLLGFWEESEDTSSITDPVFFSGGVSISYSEWGDIADQCLLYDRRKRPNMDQVVQNLASLSSLSFC